MEQLTMFDAHFADERKEKEAIRKEQRKKEKMDFWLTHFNWRAQVNELARIDETIAFCETLEKRCYSYCMRVKILSITNDTARVETTEEWEEACSGGGFNKAGLIWNIAIENLAPILNK